jgi:hypothetical protein
LNQSISPSSTSQARVKPTQKGEQLPAAHHVRAVDPISHTIEIIESGTRKS